MVLNADVF